MFVFIRSKLSYRWVCRAPLRTDMDEYDELFEIEDNFDDQFADELEVLAEMNKGEDQLANKVTPGPATDIIFSKRRLHLIHLS